MSSRGKRTGSRTSKKRVRNAKRKEVDGIKFFTRYRYSGTVQTNTRPFCREMIRRDKMYRKEDIIRMTTYILVFQI